MKILKIDKLLLIVLLVPTVSSLIISSVYAGKKKYKTFSFGSPLLPAIVKVQPHRFHLTFRQSKYLKTPQFHIEGTLPLKAPTIIKEIIKPDPNPEVVEYNIGNVDANRVEATYAESNNYQTIAPYVREPPPLLPSTQLPSLPMIPPINEQRFVNKPIVPNPNNYNLHYPMKRSADDYHNQFHSNPQNPYFRENYDQNFPMSQPNNYPVYNDNNPQQYHPPQNGQRFFSPNNLRNYNNPNVGINPYNNYNMPHNQHSNNNYHNYHNNPVIHSSSSSFAPQKYHKVFVSSDPKNTGWIPITNGHNNYYPPPPNNLNSGHSSNKVTMVLPNYGNAVGPSDEKINIGEHYNPSASYVDEHAVEKPTYDPDEGSISFSISGPHGGEKVPIGYEDKVKEHQEQLKKYPDHLPPGLDIPQLTKYYHHHTFTDNLKDDYGFVGAVGPFSFLKSKLSSLKKLI
jgi:hypothetical protein